MVEIIPNHETHHNIIELIFEILTEGNLNQYISNYTTQRNFFTFGQLQTVKSLGHEKRVLCPNFASKTMGI